MKNNESGVRLFLDCTPLKEKGSQLVDELKLLFPDGIPDDFGSLLAGLCDDIILCEFTSTTGADGTLQITQRADFGGRFDEVLAAARTGNFNI